MHLGSLLTAVGSWLDARQHGECLLRIDDLDEPRCRPEHETTIEQALTAFGLDYPSPILRQSARRARYAQLLDRLSAQLPLFHCDCTRRDLAGDGEPCCVRDCRKNPRDPANSALRADLTGLSPRRVVDRSLGVIEFDPALQRDVVVRRRDGLHAYQLACVIDDADQGITDVVRGADLLPSTRWQIALQQALGFSSPTYLHLPLVLEADGRKLAKSDRAAALEPTRAAAELRQVLTWLKQEKPPAECNSAGAILTWMLPRWDPARFAGLSEVRQSR